MPSAKFRFQYAAAFTVGLCMLGGALYVQYQANVEPSPLCILQRIWLLAAMLVSVIAGLHGSVAVGRRLYSPLVLVLAIGGGLTAVWQLYLQDLPDDRVIDCLPSLDAVVSSLPWQKTIGLFLRGSADCAEVAWSLFGMSLPEWSLLGFIGLAVSMAWPLLHRR